MYHKFEDYLSGAWGLHGKDAVAVARDFPVGMGLVQNADQAGQLAHLICHVFGEHLGQWSDGVAALRELRKVLSSQSLGDTQEARAALVRAEESLKLCSGSGHDLSILSKSDQIRTLAVSASALGERDVARAEALFRQAILLAEGLDRGDPANRALAITGNNLACALEEKVNRTQGQSDLMIFSAQIARRFWEIAGTPSHVAVAEYRLAKSYLKTGLPEEGLRHALLGLEICEKNQASAYDLFYALESVAEAYQAIGNSEAHHAARRKMFSTFERLTPEEKKTCQATFDRFTGTSFSAPLKTTR